MTGRITVRPETVQDYHAISEIHTAAFDYAKHTGEAAGHALFSPCVLRLKTEPVPVVILAPLAVHPLWQRKGNGEAARSIGPSSSIFADSEAARLDNRREVSKTFDEAAHANDQQRRKLIPRGRMYGGRPGIQIFQFCHDVR